MGGLGVNVVVTGSGGNIKENTVGIVAGTIRVYRCQAELVFTSVQRGECEFTVWCRLLVHNLMVVVESFLIYVSTHVIDLVTVVFTVNGHILEYIEFLVQIKYLLRQ